MEKLKNVFEERDSVFSEKTHEIFALIHSTLVCVTDFLNDIDPMFDAGIITWEDASLIDNMIVIVGIVDYELGTEIDIDGNVIVITEDNLDHFQRVVHMSLPDEVVASKDSDRITKFLYELHENDNPGIFSDTIAPTPPALADFDLSKLTEDQRQSLLLHSGNKQKN